MSNKNNMLVGALKWAFGKDGANTTVYLLLYLLIYYWQTLCLYVPEALLFVGIGVVINVNNNTLKNAMRLIQEKYEDAKKLVFYIRNGKNVDEALEIIKEEKTERTLIQRDAVPIPIPQERGIPSPFAIEKLE